LWLKVSGKKSKRGDKYQSILKEKKREEKKPAGGKRPKGGRSKQLRIGVLLKADTYGFTGKKAERGKRNSASQSSFRVKSLEKRKGGIKTKKHCYREQSRDDEAGANSNDKTDQGMKTRKRGEVNNRKRTSNQEEGNQQKTNQP